MEYGGEVIIEKGGSCDFFHLSGGKLECHGHITHCRLHPDGNEDGLLHEYHGCASIEDGAVIDNFFIEESEVRFKPGSETHNLSQEDCYTTIHIYKGAKVDGNLDSGYIVFHGGATLPPGLRIRREKGGDFHLSYKP